MDWAMVTYKAQHMPTRPELLHSVGYTVTSLLTPKYKLALAISVYLTLHHFTKSSFCKNYKCEEKVNY